MFLTVFRILTNHPPPRASHANAAAAVAGYVQGLQKRSLTTTNEYLLPSRRGRTPGMLEGLARHRVVLENLHELQVLQTQGGASVTLQLQVCYRNPGQRHSTCQLLSRAPLGLPDVIECRHQDGSWYAATLFQVS